MRMILQGLTSSILFDIVKNNRLNNALQYFRVTTHLVQKPDCGVMGLILVTGGIQGYRQMAGGRLPISEYTG